ncbi:MAG: carboxylating nicotinate-nucleotide diphosphorylase [bacterium]|nr:carboxylating nicotinate-nucleotide diphosphorylase [bacterium]
MDELSQQQLTLVKQALDEDIGAGDLTSMACLEPNPVVGSIRAKSSGVLSGVQPALLAFEIVDSANRIIPVKKDGDKFCSTDTIFEIEGFNQTVLTAERTALNFLAHLSGIASLTSRFVEAVSHTDCKIIDTRKTTPGWRLLEKQAVVDGGGENHRIGLYDMILIKDNHIASAGSVTAAVSLAREFLQTPDFRLQFDLTADLVIIEVEVVSGEQLSEAIKAGADRLLLDNRNNDELADLVQLAHRINPEVKLEASGNMSLDRVGSVADTGVDFISVGALTHSALASDFSLKVTSVESS